MCFGEGKLEVTNNAIRISVVFCFNFTSTYLLKLELALSFSPRLINCWLDIAHAPTSSYTNTDSTQNREPTAGSKPSLNYLTNVVN